MTCKGRLPGHETPVLVFAFRGYWSFPSTFLARCNPRVSPSRLKNPEHGRRHDIRTDFTTGQGH